MRDSLENEQAVLGSMLLAPAQIDVLSTQERLKPEHFAYPAHRLIWRTMLDLRDKDGAVDEVTLRNAMNGKADRAVIANLMSALPMAAHYRDYAKAVIASATRRRDKQAARLLLNAIDAEDDDEQAKALAVLNTPPEEIIDLVYSPSRRGDSLWARIEGKDEDEVFPFPFNKLNRMTDGGMRRGQVTLLAGWTSHLKSVVLDQTLQHVAKTHNVHLFINEMMPLDRTIRDVQRATGIPGHRLNHRDLSKDEMTEVARALGDLRYGITKCGDMGVEEIARRIRLGGWDVVGLDILHLIEHSDERDMRVISRTLNQAAKAGKGCHIIATAHLNEHRAHQGVLPQPQLGDIRQSGMLKNDADNVLFTYRYQDENGKPTNEGVLYFRKVRAGEIGGVNYHFDSKRMRIGALTNV